MSNQESLRIAAEQFERDGYTVIRNFYSADEAAELEQQVEQYIAKTLPALESRSAFYEDDDDPQTLFRLEHMQKYDPTFAAMLEDDTLRDVAANLLQDDAAPRDLQLFGKAPIVGHETPPHQDGFYFKLDPNEALTLWLPLDPTDEANGCIRYVRGSHRRGMRPHGVSKIFGFSQGVRDFSRNDIDLEDAIVAAPGDLIAHHSMTIHRADANGSPRRRWALGFVYYAARAQPDIEALADQERQVKDQWGSLGRKR